MRLQHVARFTGQNLPRALAVLLATSTQLDDAVNFLQVIGWDGTSGHFNFYERRYGAWVWAGDSRNALDPKSRGKGPFDSHVNGGLVMKELKAPWAHWKSQSADQLPGIAPDDPLRGEDVFQRAEGAEALEGLPNVEVEVFGDLVVDFARRFGARTMVKGLRAISDFEWEFQMHHLNRNLAPEVETMYLMSSPQYSFLSSSGVKEVASFGGDVHDLVPEPVAKRFREMFPEAKGGAPVSPQE